MTAPYQLLPPLTDTEYADLKADIAAHGVRVPIDVDEHNNILDGHHRARAAAELGIALPVRTIRDLDEAGKVAHAIAVNVHRRTLNSQQKRDLIAASLRAEPEASNREHARRVGVSDHTVDDVRREMESGAQIAHLDTRTNPQGRPQPARKPLAPLPDPDEPTRPEPSPPDPISDAKNKAKTSPRIVGDKAVVRFRDATRTVAAAGGVDAILADTDDFDDIAPLWLFDIEQALHVLTAWQAALRRRRIRSVK